MKLSFFLPVFLFAGNMLSAQDTTVKRDPSLVQFLDANPDVAALVDEKDSINLRRKISKLGNSNDESDRILIKNYYNVMKNGVKADSVHKVILKKFPLGITAFTADMHDIFNETDGDENEKRHARFVARYSKNPKLKGHPFFGYVKYYVALSYMNNKPEKMIPWISKIEDSVYRTKAFSYGAQELATKGKTKEAEPLIRKALADLQERSQTETQEYTRCASVAAEILLANKKYEEGYPFIKLVYDRSTEKQKKSPYLIDTYLNLLVGTERYAEAYPMMEESIKSGNASALVRERFEKAFRTVKGSDADFATHYASLVEVYKKRIQEEMAAKMVNEPAFNFVVKNLKGETVSLTDFRGKVLVLDFWATWCGPCKAAFPKMQLAVNKYKNDPEVEFLFIHTLERTDGAAKTAEDYIKANHYTFNVLMDYKDPETKVNPAVAGYGIKGIPAKFVIDKKGNIRFRAVGNMPGGDDSFLTEMTTMIELARKTP